MPENNSTQTISVEKLIEMLSAIEDKTKPVKFPVMIDSLEWGHMNGIEEEKDGVLIY